MTGGGRRLRLAFGLAVGCLCRCGRPQMIASWYASTRSARVSASSLGQSVQSVEMVAVSGMMGSGRDRGNR